MPAHTVKFIACSPRGYLLVDEKGEGSLVNEARATEWGSPQAAWLAVEQAARRARAGAQSDADLAGWARVACGLATPSGFFIAPPKKGFEFHERPSAQEVAAPIDIFYVRSASQGWLGRKGWTENFAWAIGFLSREQALASCNGTALDDLCVLKARSVFVEVALAPGSQLCPDPTLEGIQAAREAREIEANLASLGASEGASRL